MGGKRWGQKNTSSYNIPHIHIRLSLVSIFFIFVVCLILLKSQSSIDEKLRAKVEQRQTAINILIYRYRHLWWGQRGCNTVLFWWRKGSHVSIPMLRLGAVHLANKSGSRSRIFYGGEQPINQRKFAPFQCRLSSSKKSDQVLFSQPFFGALSIFLLVDPSRSKLVSRRVLRNSETTKN